MLGKSGRWIMELMAGELGSTSLRLYRGLMGWAVLVKWLELAKQGYKSSSD
jgi:hypothetical protein